MKKSMFKHGSILALAAFLCVLLVVITHSLTKDTIAASQQKLRLALLNQVIPPELHDNELTKSCRLVQNDSLSKNPVPAYVATLNGELSAIAIETLAPDGYSGNIRILLAANAQNQIIGVRTLEHNETPGLGDKIDIRIDDWINSFIGKTIDSENDARWAVKKDGGVFDQFTGATITPRAVVNASKNALLYLKNHREQILSSAKNCGDSQ